MNSRLEPQRLAEVDNILSTLTPFLDELVDRFAEFLDTHELTAAHQAVFDMLDSSYTPASVQWILALAIGREALRRKVESHSAPWTELGNAALWDSTIAARRHSDVPVGAPIPRTPKQLAATWGRNAVEVHDEPANDAAQILSALDDKTAGTASEGEAPA